MAVTQTKWNISMSFLPVGRAGSYTKISLHRKCLQISTDVNRNSYFSSYKKTDPAYSLWAEKYYSQQLTGDSSLFSPELALSSCSLLGCGYARWAGVYCRVSENYAVMCPQLETRGFPFTEWCLSISFLCKLARYLYIIASACLVYSLIDLFST